MGGNFDSAPREAYDDDFLSMGIAEIEVVVNLREEVEELGKGNDSLDADRDCDSHRHDVEEVNVGNRKTVLHLFAGSRQRFN